MRLGRLARSVSIVSLISIPLIGAQPPLSRMPPLTLESLNSPIDLRDGIGLARDPLVQLDPAAQRYFDQGLSFLHDYEWLEAVQSFREAARHGAPAPIVDIEISYAYDALNMRSAASALLAGLRRGAPLDPHTSTHLDLRERELIAETAPDPAARQSEYRQAIDAALRRFPDDPELWLLRGLAEARAPGDRGQGSVASAVPHYRRALALLPGGFAPHHYLAHAYENSGDTVNAAAEARTYAGLAPRIPHAHHMLGHSLRRSGHIKEAIGEFETADALHQSGAHAHNSVSGIDWHYEHNLDLLGTCYQYVGQMRKASQLLAKAFELPTANLVQAINKRQWLLLLRAGARADDLISSAAALAAYPHPAVEAVAHIEAAHGWLLKGEPARAGSEADAADSALRRSGTAIPLADVARQLLEGELLLGKGRTAEGERAILGAIARARTFTGPDEWAQTLFSMELAASAARSAGDWPLAERVASAMVEYDGAYGGGQYAVALAREHAGDRAGATAAFQRARTAWADADPGFVPLTVINQRLGATR